MLATTSRARARTDLTIDLTVPELLERAVRRGEGQLSAQGGLVVDTGAHTGRSPKDKYVVRDDATESRVWWGSVNQPMSPDAFARFRDDVAGHLRARGGFVVRVSAVARASRAVPVTVATERAWHALFSRQMFRPALPAAADPGWTVLHAPSMPADPARHETRSSVAVALSLSERTVAIAGTAYAGEIKKSLFAALQDALPRAGVATMHCSANAAPNGEVALFFGLSGTGKTTLSIDPGRTLIGDDEHGWDDEGVFNFEGGSYAKVINLSPAAEPEIDRAARRFGTVLENVVLDPRTREVDFRDGSRTENTRAAFAMSALRNAGCGVGGHPTRILFLAADAFGVLPPVARLTPEQAAYWYLSGYTARLAGTERGVTVPEATFSACFGAPFLTLPAERYAELLTGRIRRHQPEVWLVNTGWTGGPHRVGGRMPIRLTRGIVRAVLDGSLGQVPSVVDPVWRFRVPVACPGVPDAPLRPRETWADPDAFDAATRRVAIDFAENFRQFADRVPAEVRAAGPIVPHDADEAALPG